MKELTIEQKAKVYDEALERAKVIIRNYESRNLTNVLFYAKEYLSFIFPEFKENEDEMIRKEIINYFQCQSQDEPSRKDIHNKWIAWLEKQGEKKTAIEAWKEMRLEVYAQASGNRHEPNYSDDKTKMFSLSDIDEIIEKISEQKPTDEVEQEYHCNGVREPKESTGVLKQLLDKENYAWSEEDENEYAHILKTINLVAKEQETKGYNNLNSSIKWLKHLKDRVQPYNRWKPSDEQMDALETAVSSLQSTAIESLYNELKKLKEE